VRQLGVLDTEAESALDAFTPPAASITGVPIARISLVDQDRQWFKSAVGRPQSVVQALLMREKEQSLAFRLKTERALRGSQARLRTITDLMPQIKSRPHGLELPAALPAPHALGDRVRLVQVLSNLLHNAAQYTPEGGHLRVLMKARGHEAVVRVSDNGSRIAQELRPHVFELFTQAARMPDRAQAAPTSEQPTHADPALAAGRAGGPTAEPPLRVMVVDDHPDAAELLGIWLEAQGHDVEVCTDPFVALEAARARPARVYVLDIGLPGMDGHELARKLRQDPRNHDAALIALTGYGQAQDILQSREAGFDQHFVKPADPTRLAVVIDSLAC
jgi:CheY-like chemotaxis protein